MANSIETAKRQTTIGVLVAIGLLALIFGYSFIILYRADTYSPSNPIWFVGLLIIFGAALSLISVVFGWLGMSSPGEAFALPTGSIRTLLAIGIMILFAVFGLASVSADGASKRPAEKEFASVTFAGTPDAVAKEIQRYEASGVVAVVDSSDGNNAKMTLFRVESYQSQATIDIEKQIITALITLVTSVVSFYFGSRSVEASRNAKDVANKIAPPTLPASLANEVKLVDDAISNGIARLDRLRAEPAPADNQAPFAAKVGQAEMALKLVQDNRSALEATSNDLASGKATPESISAAIGALKPRVAELEMVLSEAEALVAKG